MGAEQFKSERCLRRSLGLDRGYGLGESSTSYMRPLKYDKYRLRERITPKGKPLSTWDISSTSAGNCDAAVSPEY